MLNHEAARCYSHLLRSGVNDHAKVLREGSADLDGYVFQNLSPKAECPDFNAVNPGLQRSDLVVSLAVSLSSPFLTRVLVAHCNCGPRNHCAGRIKDSAEQPSAGLTVGRGDKNEIQAS